MEERHLAWLQNIQYYGSGIKIIMNAPGHGSAQELYQDWQAYWAAERGLGIIGEAVRRLRDDNFMLKKYLTNNCI